LKLHHSVKQPQLIENLNSFVRF